MKKLLYATTNPGKIFEVGKLLQRYGIDILSLKDLDISADVEESGNSLEENAKIKAESYRKMVPSSYVVMTDDTGVEIDALNGEPGIHVRRWKDKKARMSDEEIIQYCLLRMKDVPVKKRTAQFRTVIALSPPAGEIELFDGVLPGIIREKAAKLRIEGLPFGPIFFVPEWKMLLNDVHQLPLQKQAKFLTHRQKTVEKAVLRIKSLLSV